MAPMTRSRAVENNTPNDLMAQYYGQRTEAGLIITEGTSPSINGLGYPRIPAIYNQSHVEGWKKITQAVHDGGSRIFVQLMHTGRVTHTDNLPQGGRTLAPSADKVSGEMYVDGKGPQPHSEPAEMTTEEVKEAVQEYINAARLAIEAGFDGVEIHGANGYLVEQFTNPITNKRTDEYGGSIENRVRFLEEVAKGITEAIGEDRTGLRISPYGVFNDTGAFDDINDQFEYLSKKMSEIGLVYIHVVDHAAMGAPEVPAEIKSIIRSNFTGTYILSGGYDQARAETDLIGDKGDLVAFGRPFLANPDLVSRFESGAELAQPNMDLLYTPGAEGYTDYPSLAEA